MKEYDCIRDQARNSLPMIAKLKGIKEGITGNRLRTMPKILIPTTLLNERGL